MIFSFNTRRARGRSLVGAAVLLAAVGCTRDERADRRAEAQPTAAPGAGAAAVIGALKLVRQEYANAVPPEGGTVADATEYAETELFAEQAETKFAALPAGGDGARGAEIRDGLAGIRAAVARQAPPAEVTSAATRTLALVEELLAGEVPEQIRGAVLATARADQAIAAEELVGEYRVGVVAGPPRTVFQRRNGVLAPAPAAAGTAYLAVALRERRTKRFLPAAEVTASLEQDGRRTDVVLPELWGDFHQYGANVPLPGDGAVTISVRATPPAYARHGDMLTHFVAPVTATLQARVAHGALLFDAKPVQPPDADYAIGDDVLQAFTEAGTLRDAGPYRVGVIVEGPEPIWTWHDGAPVLAPVAADATNHLEVVLVDAESGQLVPDARVAVTFLGGGRELGTATLYPLLSIFSHYGNTLALPPATTSVRVHIDPPALGSLDRPRLERGVELELPLPARREAHA